MTILVTGATGLVGTRLLSRLAEAGMDCRALVRSGRNLPAGVTAVEGDLFDPASLVRAVRDVSAIIHFAAVFRSPDTDLIWKSNLEGTRNLIAATKAHASGARFIMSSTSNVYNTDNAHPGREGDARGSDECQIVSGSKDEHDPSSRHCHGHDPRPDRGNGRACCQYH